MEKQDEEKEDEEDEEDEEGGLGQTNHFDSLMEDLLAVSRRRPRKSAS